jgi:hypothetical protein
MKTVNFLEALEANKTRRVKTDHHDSNWHEVGEYRKIVSSNVGDVLQAVTYRWLIEPEVIEFTCEWLSKELYTSDELPCQIIFPDGFKYEILNSVVGKRTRVRIEVL